MRTVTTTIEDWPLKEPFCITGKTFENVDLLVVSVSDGHVEGRGEASGVFYLGETVDQLREQVHSIEAEIENGLGRDRLSQHLPIGGARNAVDCALWDLDARRSGSDVFELASVSSKPVVTANTVGIASTKEMAKQAKSARSTVIKVKLDSEKPVERITAVVEARPDAEVVVDVNGGWTISHLSDLAPKLAVLGVKMIEQPLARGEDDELAEFDSPVPLCADESCLDASELEYAVGRYQMINIKLDKTGGLTEALVLAKRARTLGMQLMVGNMLGTSLAMAPALVVANLCDFVDLDGPLFFANDRSNALHYDSTGAVSGMNAALWGG